MFDMKEFGEQQSNRWTGYQPISPCSRALICIRAGREIRAVQAQSFLTIPFSTNAFSKPSK